MRKITLYLVSFMTVIILLTGCSAIGGNNSSKNLSNGSVIDYPETDGTIKSIQAGNPSYAILNEVEIIDKDPVKTYLKTYKSMLKVELPNGHFISPNHWQSEGDNLDLFIGDTLTLSGDHIMDTATDNPGLDGIVKSISSDKIVIQKVLYNEDGGYGGMKYSSETATILLAPYTIVSFNDNKNVETSKIKKDDAVSLILIGPPDDYIATKIIDFRDVSNAWHMVNEPQP